VPRLAAVDSALARAAVLEELEMGYEARQEYEWLERTSDLSRERLLATAFAFAERGMAARAITLGVRAVNSGVARDTTIDRLIYPVAYERILEAEAERHGLDAALMAALIRQESSFTPAATSAAGARGLMQVMPAVGRRIARSRHFPHWEPSLLYQPDVNIQLGATHLATLVRQYGPIEHVLAAYNAGGTRVARWSRKRGVNDAEIFVERIPFEETRDYVRIVLRNREFYRSLYSL
jgi:soluble lytic murein transglycosylase